MVEQQLGVIAEQLAAMQEQLGQIKSKTCKCITELTSNHAKQFALLSVNVMVS